MFGAMGRMGDPSIDPWREHLGQGSADVDETPDEDLESLDGRRFEGSASATAFETTRKGWALRFAFEERRRVEQHDFGDLQFGIEHSNTFLLGLARGADVGAVGGGEISAGVGVDIRAIQSIDLDSRADAADEETREQRYERYVADAWTRIWFSDIDPELDVGTILGAQWHRSELFGGAHAASIGLVAENLAAIGPESAGSERFRAGISLDPVGTWPSLAIDYGAFKGLDRESVTGIGATLQFEWGPLGLAASHRPDATIVGGSVSVRGLELTYGWLHSREEEARTPVDDTVHMIGVALVPSLAGGGGE